MARLNHARKTSRIDNITDTFNWLMSSSDPYMSSLRREAKRKRKRGRKKMFKRDRRLRKRLKMSD